MAASATSRPHAGRINVHEPSDYPIVLGDSFKNEASSTSRYLRLRYNWEPQHGFSKQKGTLKKSNGQVQLLYKDNKTESSTYDYSAAAITDVDDHADDKRTTQLALIFDPSKSAYVLEQISQSLDLNLTSAHDQSKSEVRQHRQINSADLGDLPTQINGAKVVSDQDEDEADPTNPFDFRHFLSEAKENAEKAAQPVATGSRTPVTGNRTPMSGVSSPSLGAARFLPTGTPQFRPTPTSVPLPKKTAPSKPAISVTSKKQATTKRKPAAPKSRVSQPISNELVHESSDEDTQDTIALTASQSSHPREQGHNRNVSSNSVAQSPHIVVDNGGLEIDLGSPPPETKRKSMLDLDAFRSQTHTPTLGFSSNRPLPPRSHGDIEMRDESEDERDEEEEDEHHEDADANMDEDVEEFELGSPRSKKADEGKDELGKAPSPPTPLPPPPAYDEEEDDDFLAAELAAALGDDDPPANVADDDESEISEEE